MILAQRSLGLKLWWIAIERGSLLPSSNLPLTFWEHALKSKTATYLHNRTTTASNFHSPYEKLYAKPPDYAFLKTFGCLCYLFLRPFNQHKMDF
ncbi:hypothetical protein LXL04_000218 [Taraxacum kok-saghyz]